MIRGSQGATGQRADREHTQRVPYKDACGRCGAVRVDLQLGLEKTPEEYISRAVSIFADVRRVLRDDGTLWVNIGDSYTSGGRDYRDAGRSEYNGGNEGAYQGLQEKGSRHPVPIGLKPKDLVGIPWMLAFALRADGWYLRSDIIWSKPNPMPESVTDRPTKAHEYLFLLAKSESYHYDSEAISEPSVSDGSGNGFKRTAHLSYLDGDGPRGSDKQWKPNGKHAATAPQSPGRRMVENVAKKRSGGADYDSPFGGTRNRRSVWTVTTKPFLEAHFATFPEKLIEPCILAGCPTGGTVLDPFSGSGTTGLVARRLGCNFIGIELNPAYIAIAEKRLSQEVLDLQETPA